jgi:hypothetical protein
MRTNHHFSENGPAVQLSAAHSIFPFQLAHFWKQQGLDTALVTRDLRHDSHGPHGTPIVCSANYRTALDRALTFAPVSLVAHYFEKALIMPFRSRYYRRTGRPRNEAREERFVRHLVAASPTARAARSFSPRFVFGHEITHYGLATAMCDGIPRILFPWGGDVFLYAETSPFMSWIVRRALKSVDLVLPSSTTAARHIQERFGVSPEVAQPLSWGIDRADFERADPPTRVRLLSELGVTDDSRLVLNSRQFNPIWGCFETLDAFLETRSNLAVSSTDSRSLTDRCL